VTYENTETREGVDHRVKPPSRRRAIRVGVGVGLVVAVVSVVSVLTGGKVTGGKSGPTSALVGHHLEKFTLAGLNGGVVEAPWAANRASVIVFFASYCGPCQNEMPKIAKYIRTHNPRPVEVVAVDAVDVRSSAQSMIKKDDVTFPVAFDPQGVVTSGIFGFVNVPESVFVNARGVVTGVHYGAIPKKQLATAIASLGTKPVT
jgi:thiol-disulfide isomerase/thioredoxin